MTRRHGVRLREGVVPGWAARAERGHGVVAAEGAVVDVEGAEGELFDRAQLPGVTKIMLELHERVIGEDKARQLRAALNALGFKEVPGLSSREHLVLRR